MPQRDRVILVHGLWMYGFCMAFMQRRIERSGYDVECWSYPTVRATLRDNAEQLAEYCRRHPGSRLHIVGHSMGGLIAVSAAAAGSIPCLGRVVAAGTPLADSFSARRLEQLPGGRMMLGQCISEWLHGPRIEVAATCELGVIAGRGGIGLGRLIAPDLPTPNDGVIAVEETRIPGLRDHIVLNVSHTEMLASAAVAHQVCAFLEAGAFDAAGAGTT